MKCYQRSLIFMIIKTLLCLSYFSLCLCNSEGREYSTCTQDLEIPKYDKLPVDEKMVAHIGSVFKEMIKFGSFENSTTSKSPCYVWNCQFENWLGQTCRYCLPYVMIAGFSKCGTSTLHTRLLAHPNFQDYGMKEANIFTREWVYNHNNSLADFEVKYECNNVNRANGNIYWLDGSAGALGSATGAISLQKYSPQTKVIALVRDPYQRLSSWLHMVHADKIKDKHDFDKVMRMYLEKPSHLDYFYMTNNLMEWKKIIGSENLHIVDYYDLVYSPEAVMDNLSKFLKVSFAIYPESILGSAMNTKNNRGHGTAGNSSGIAQYHIEQSSLQKLEKLFEPSLCYFEKEFGFPVKLITVPSTSNDSSIVRYPSIE